MRRGRIILALATALAVVLTTAAAAVAASPRQIYADLAQHGKLTKHYSAADLKRASKDAVLQGYGGVGAGGGVQQPAGGTQGQSNSSAGGVEAAVSPVQQTNTTGTLPFTGIQLGVFVAVGLVLLAGGLMLRRAGRSRTRA
jgi:hypothetical protein